MVTPHTPPPPPELNGSRLYYYLLEYNPKIDAKPDEEGWNWEITNMVPTIEQAKEIFLDALYSETLGGFFVKHPTGQKVKKSVRNVKLCSIPFTVIEEGEPR